jgi:hypothetical protein
MHAFLSCVRYLSTLRLLRFTAVVNGLGFAAEDAAEGKDADSA